MNTTQLKIHLLICITAVTTFGLGLNAQQAEAPAGEMPAQPADPAPPTESELTFSGIAGRGTYSQQVTKETVASFDLVVAAQMRSDGTSVGHVRLTGIGSGAVEKISCRPHKQGELWSITVRRTDAEADPKYGPDYFIVHIWNVGDGKRQFDAVAWDYYQAGTPWEKGPTATMKPTSLEHGDFRSH